MISKEQLAKVKRIRRGLGLIKKNVKKLTTYSVPVTPHNSPSSEPEGETPATVSVLKARNSWKQHLLRLQLKQLIEQQQLAKACATR